MTVYCGVDFHARLQTVSYCDTSDGEIHQRDLHHHKDDIRAFYSQFSGDVLLGLEAGLSASGARLFNSATRSESADQSSWAMRPG
jgi:hypothetical protein